MTDYIRLKKGLDLPISGSPDPVIKKDVISDVIAIKPTDFKGLIPRLLVKEGDAVLVGSPLFCSKVDPRIQFTSPISGTIKEVVRGEKRKLLEIRIANDNRQEARSFKVEAPEKMNRNAIQDLLLESGLWACIKQRPYGILANPDSEPKAIFISGFNSAPLAANLDFVAKDELQALQTGINALNKLTSGGVHLGLHQSNHASTPLHKLNNVKIHVFSGPHPSGNVGVQIHHVAPIQKGELVWTVQLHQVIFIGRLLMNGYCDFSQLVAITGPRAAAPAYVRATVGMSMQAIADQATTTAEGLQEGCPVRFVSGNVLTGTNVGENGYLGFFDNQVTLLTEGSYYEMFGWAKPFRCKKFSFSRAYFSWLAPKKQYAMDTNLNGGERAFVLSGYYEKVLPMHIFPVYLLKAILAGNIDKMEMFGIYEVIEEDLALCEYICPSKIEVQDIISKGIDMMIKEMA
ncbi:MAG: Na(+)-translocating NADH-quinone reductase subunit A [Bacteroidales bacterium]|nr:Na(+)-translocating NADH-quinone reductase subunit A [Bacteroidales bacterium]